MSNTFVGSVRKRLSTIDTGPRVGGDGKFRRPRAGRFVTTAYLFFRRATPKKRGQVFGEILHRDHKVVVPDRAAFVTQVECWLKEAVVEVKR